MCQVLEFAHVARLAALRTSPLKMVTRGLVLNRTWYRNSDWLLHRPPSFYREESQTRLGRAWLCVDWFHMRPEP